MGWVLTFSEKIFKIALWRHRNFDFSKKFFFWKKNFYKIYLLLGFLSDRGVWYLKRTVLSVGSKLWEWIFRFFSFLPIFFKKSAKNIFFEVFWQKIGKNEKNRKIHFQRFGCTDFTLLLSYHPAWSDNRAVLKKN